MSRAPGSYAGLTVKQADLLSFIRTEAAGGRTPSFAEMASHCQLKSKNGVHRLITGLAERGYVGRRARCSRSVVAIDTPAPRTLRDATERQILDELTRRGLRVTLV